MADSETGEPRLDSETGEERDTSVMSFPALVRCRQARAVQVTVATDAETGENEWSTSSSPPQDEARRSPAFHIPASLQLGAPLADDRCLSHVICLLPALLLFPALTVAVCLFTEVGIHCWHHKRERRRRPGDKTTHCFHLSPLHKFVSAFCGHCQSNRLFQIMGKDQQEKLRNLRLKFKNESFCAMKREGVS